MAVFGKRKITDKKNVQTRIRTDKCVFMVIYIYMYDLYIYDYVCIRLIQFWIPSSVKLDVLPSQLHLLLPKKKRSIKSVLRKMLQRSIKSVLEVTWEKRYNVAKSVLEVTHPNQPHPWHSITSMRKCQGTLLPTPPHPTTPHPIPPWTSTTSISKHQGTLLPTPPHLSPPHPSLRQWASVRNVIAHHSPPHQKQGKIKINNV